VYTAYDTELVQQPVTLGRHNADETTARAEIRIKKTAKTFQIVDKSNSYTVTVKSYKTYHRLANYHSEGLYTVGPYTVY